ncbi:MAG: dienelactone hydrolase family protein [Myxococcales bacterium]|nr:dienelactone hydrolase family protein [Myxococcales bacterium]MCB9734141.1 dienelactone hydrolase family protein [Deltaproteobacteria bacterium]
MGQMIEFADGAHDAYLAVPESGGGPGVLVIQEWWGLVDHVKDLADRFAEAGFVALAPDLYEGETTKAPDQAGKLMMALNIGKTAEKLGSAVDALVAHGATKGDKVGAVGFCMGGQLALFAATTDERIGACVDFYGIHPNVEPDLSKLAGPVVGFFAEKDGFVDLAAVTKLMQAMGEAGARFEVHRYLDTDHAFMNDTRPEVFHAEHAREAWDITTRFLHAQLGA